MLDLLQSTFDALRLHGVDVIKVSVSFIQGPPRW